ncbi:MAG TPA: toll/interleukin-1 receptor domain-containing protein [Caulobacterales bacterium]|nr:toll/interleukin-1 receptor domain-containing protein [Caulobacterales bacterium]
MADIFISYKREDRQSAERLASALHQLGFDVWWDFELLSGDRYRNVIRAVIDQCRAAIVLWSAKAVESDFVMDEATYAKSQGKLCPARIDDVQLPFGFGQIHTDDLSHWEGELSHQGFANLVRAVEERVGRKGRLGAAPQSTEGQASAAELEAFKAAQIANNTPALQAFLRAHPRGAFAGFVRDQLASVDAVRPAPPDPPAHAREAAVAAKPAPAGAVRASVIFFVLAFAVTQLWSIPALWEPLGKVAFYLPGAGDQWQFGLPDAVAVFLCGFGGAYAAKACGRASIGPALAFAGLNLFVTIAIAYLSVALGLATLNGGLAFDLAVNSLPIILTAAAALMWTKAQSSRRGRS